MAYESTDAKARGTLFYATDAGENVVGIAWSPSKGVGNVTWLWGMRGWTVKHVHRDHAGPILAAFEAHKKGSAK